MHADMGETKARSRLHQQIDENLKRVYEEALSEDIPDRFKQLIAQLRARETDAEERGR
ncbi:NepR family anti-sigma factor [Rubellimicrobium sp. CFH 75288]|uniref:NepR family anti-sigma factor n=1 Tax=Rubellimicrobium sp. CFH 75288 TaxID=2697034 RepID=UPI001FB58427|nr:NepR family anti-sigma factor [Rubellimicrobium sp. CFH 75288]